MLLGLLIALPIALVLAWHFQPFQTQVHLEFDDFHSRYLYFGLAYTAKFGMPFLRSDYHTPMRISPITSRCHMKLVQI